MVSAADPSQSLISVFLTGVANFLSSSYSFILTRAEWIPFQTLCCSENLVASGIEPGTSGLAARNSDHYTTEVVELIVNPNEIPTIRFCMVYHRSVGVVRSRTKGHGVCLFVVL
jgi:hypothetical protein